MTHPIIIPTDAINKAYQDLARITQSQTNLHGQTNTEAIKQIKQLPNHNKRISSEEAAKKHWLIRRNKNVTFHKNPRVLMC